MSPVIPKSMKSMLGDPKLTPGADSHPHPHPHTLTHSLRPSRCLKRKVQENAFPAENLVIAVVLGG